MRRPCADPFGVPEMCQSLFQPPYLIGYTTEMSCDGFRAERGLIFRVHGATTSVYGNLPADALTPKEKLRIGEQTFEFESFKLKDIFNTLLFFNVMIIAL